MQFISQLLSFLNDMFLAMTWLQKAVDYFLHHILNISLDAYLFPALSFFIYDVIKIFILLSVLIYITSYLQAGFTPDKVRVLLTKFKGIQANILGALLGTVTPFCSCSSIPIFIGFTKAGLPLGVTFSFLISSPLVDIASVILLVSIFGFQIAFFYILFGLIIAVIGGTLLSVLYSKKDIEPFVFEGHLLYSEDDVMTRSKRHTFAYEQVISVIKKVWPYILIGVLIGAIIHGYIPEAFIQSLLATQSIFDVLLAVLLGAPIYADIFGTLPIAEALVSKGVGIGTVLAFMMSVTTLSIPSLILLKQVIKKKLFFGFIGIVLTGITLTGYIFNIIF